MNSEQRSARQAGQVSEGYSAVAADYAAKFEGELEYKPFDRFVLDSIVERVSGTGGGYIVDIGCGPGHVARYLADRGATAIGLDLAPAMVELARRSNPSVDYRVGDMLELPLDSASCAAVVALYSIIHLDAAELPRAFEEFARVLRPGGLLLVSFHSGTGTRHLDEWWGKKVSLDFRFLTAKEVVRTMERAGFEVEACLERAPYEEVEGATRRCYLLARSLERAAASTPERVEEKEDPILRRIAADAGVANLASLLADIPPSDLNSLWMGVSSRRAAKVTPARLLAGYAGDRYSRPSPISPITMSRLDTLAWSLLPERWTALDLSPVAPLGTVSAIGPIEQNKVLSTGRPLEVMADSTNALALEAALRRHASLKADPRSGERVRLACSHRLLRMQPFEPPATQHFRLFGMVEAGRDTGGFGFEIGAVREQIDFYLRLFAAAVEIGIEVGEASVVVLDLAGNRQSLLEDSFSGARVEAGPPTAYYTDIRFQIYGAGLMLADGGSTAFTRRLLSNDKERLVTSGLGSERLCSLAAQPAAGSDQSSRQRPIESET